MANVEFGRILEETPQNVEFGRVIEDSEVETPKFRPGAGGKAALRGLYKAAVDAAKQSPVGMLMGGALPGPVSEEFLSEKIEEILGDPQAGLLEKTIERGTETLPYLMGGEGALAYKAGRAALSSLLGQVIAEAGGEQGEQALAEILGLGLPGLGKKIIPRKGQEKSLEMLRRRGLSEKEISPLIPSEKKSATLKPFIKKGGKLPKRVKETQKALGGVYDQLIAEGESSPILSSNQTSLLQTNLNEIVDKFPAEVEKLIRSDMEKMFRKPVKASDLINLQFKINDALFGKKVSQRGLLNQLKSPINEAIREINPQVGKDFELLQKNYSHFKNTVGKNFKPSVVGDLINMGKIGGFIHGILSLNPITLKTILAHDGSRRLFTEFMINPRLQNLTQQLGKALSSNKIAIAQKIIQKIEKELKAQDFYKEEEESK